MRGNRYNPVPKPAPAPRLGFDNLRQRRMDQRPSLSKLAPAPVAKLGDAGGDLVGGGWGHGGVSFAKRRLTITFNSSEKLGTS